MHAVGAGDVTAGGDHAPVAAADDYRNVAQLRAVAFLNGGVEGVAVEMGDGETVEFLVPKDTLRAAGRAGLGVGGRPVAAVTAQSFHETDHRPCFGRRERCLFMVETKRARLADRPGLQ